MPIEIIVPKRVAAMQKRVRVHYRILLELFTLS